MSPRSTIPVLFRRAVPAVAFALAGSVLATASAADPDPRLFNQVGARVEYYEADAPVLRALVASHEATLDASGLRADLLAKVALGEARLVDSAYLVTRSGQRAKVESITEWIYPVESDPPEVSPNVTGPIAKGTDIITPLTPTAFDTRNLGLTLEFDPVVGPDKMVVGPDRMIDINLAPEIVVRTGENSHGQAESAVEQPVFHTIKSQTAISVISGQWVLLGIHAPPPSEPGGEPPADRRVACLLRAGLVAPGNPETAAKVLAAMAEFGVETPVELARLSPNPFVETPGDPEAPLNLISLRTNWYELDALVATRLLDEHSGPWADAEPLRQQLEAMVADGDATHLDSAYVVTRPGQRAKSESVRGWVYPTEMDPPEVPQHFTGPVDPEVQIQTHLSYTAFENRNVGTTLEVDPATGPDGVTIDVACAPEIVRLGATVFHGRDESRSEHPVFFTMKVQSAVTLHDGTSMLAGMHSPMPEDVTAPNFGSERRVLLVVSARLLEIK